ncbi:hypothetical protein BD779DRAFT_135487 [Infundibulicybe gibba]|nr:hypothetical protein BD779DRAFT_135487 [Infundibulicybe gibba]
MPSSSTSSTLAKRATVNGCLSGCSITCTNGLSTNPDLPLSDDCAALASAITALATSERAPKPPCNNFNVNCPNFTVPPGFEQQYSLGTCLAGFANLNDANGPSISFCDYLIGGTLPSLYTSCVTNAGNTGGFCMPGGTMVRSGHSRCGILIHSLLCPRLGAVSGSKLLRFRYYPKNMLHFRSAQ